MITNEFDSENLNATPAETSAPTSGAGATSGVESSNRANQIQLNGLRILLADDSTDNQRLFQRILVAAGAQVDLADNGAMAVAMQIAKTYDVIVMDIRMPVLDGYEATRQIRANGFAKPIIALTAHATPGEEGRCRASGCSHFHLKPIDRLSLLRAVDCAVNAD